MLSAWPRQFFYFLIALLVLNVLQAAFTDLIFDEAYYWHYAQEMAWGFFDHPPMVAAMVRLGSAIFPGELGVRIVGCLLFIGTALFLWKTVENPDKSKYIPHFFLLLFAMPLLNAYGFFNLPDTPLLFFTAALLWTYQQFLKERSFGLSLLMGILMAGLMYSKYQAALVIVLIFLSNPRLALDRYAWIALLTGILCYIPHLNWLYENDWLTINYHLSERPNRAYEFMDFTVGFFLNLILIFGLVFPVAYYALFRQKAENKFKKAQLFIVFGVLAFFFISSFNRRIQTQWIIVVCIPAFLLIYDFILTHPASRKWIYKLGVISALILLYARLGLIFDPLFPVPYESHGNKEWARSIEAVAGERPVVFEDSWRSASMYAFYSRKDAYSLNTVDYRKNQFSIDSSEDKVRNKEVLYISSETKNSVYQFTTWRGDEQQGYLRENFKSYRKLECLLESPVQRDADSVELKIHNPYPFTVNLNELDLGVAYLNEYKQVMETHPSGISLAEGTLPLIRSHDTLTCKLAIPVPRNKDHTYLRACISENTLFWGLNGKPTRISP